MKIKTITDLNHLGEGLENTPKLPSIDPKPPKPIDNTSHVKEWLKASKIDPKEKIKKPQVCLSIIDGVIEGIIGTLGNFSLIIGKAKTKKTFSLVLFLSALVANSTVARKFKGLLPDEKSKVVFFDSEQARFHVQMFYHRVCNILGIEDPVNLECYCLRQFTPSERLEIIEYYINTEPNLGFVAIDGVRDLVNSINDEEEATKIASCLLKWTEQKNIHIITVLHQNKRDENARGHLGTELVNKAETVLSVSLDPQNKKISVVEPEFCRDREPGIFAFTVNENGLPELVEGWEKVDTKSKKTLSPSEIEPEYHKAKLQEIFKDLGDEIKGGELVDGLKTIFEIGNTRAKEFRTYYLSRNWIKRNGKLRSPNQYYTLNQ
ncbi:hypothetical protein CA2015_1295 [Cyclobacterium amurskyense]|uniref:Mobilization protein n=1 Tax=Cyclobacterium amurskyense TaxID=320787 RepID=A0A0H4PD28_9BACT|nr:hypothetical protein CA2015_1295 [Cyclobacterium amurskyense]